MSDQNPEGTVTCSYCKVQYKQTGDHFKDDIGDRCPKRPLGCNCPSLEECICNQAKTWFREKQKKLIAESDLRVAKMVEAQLSKQLQEQLRRQDDARRKVRDLKAKIAELEDELEHARNALRHAQGLHTVYLEAHREAYTELRRLIDEENPNE